MPRQVKEILEDIHGGLCLTRADAVALERTTGEELTALMELAAKRRDASWGAIVTYSRKVFIPLTNLCRDTCGYCTFAQPPSSPSARLMNPEQVLEIARAGRSVGCKEALFSLGEKPEVRYAQARQALAALGYSRLIDYLRDMCELVLRETGLLPHANPGTLSEEEMALLRPVTASMGMMLENTSPRLMERGMAHYGCPDKHPEVRLQTLRNAGRLGVPFTTGLLIGIGETWTERVDSLLAIQAVFEQHGTIQEVIIQNFRAKPDIPMRHWPEPSLEQMLRTLAVARLLLDERVSLQAPPNLGFGQHVEYLRAGLNDWGGVSPVTIDHINPEAAWPRIGELRRGTESRGFRLRERLTIYPRYLREAERFVDPRLRSYLAALTGSDGLAAEQHLN